MATARPGPQQDIGRAAGCARPSCRPSGPERIKLGLCLVRAAARGPLQLSHPLSVLPQRLCGRLVGCCGTARPCVSRHAVAAGAALVAAGAAAGTCDRLRQGRAAAADPGRSRAGIPACGACGADLADGGEPRAIGLVSVRALRLCRIGADPAPIRGRRSAAASAAVDSLDQPAAAAVALSGPRAALSALLPRRMPGGRA